MDYSSALCGSRRSKPKFPGISAHPPQRVVAWQLTFLGGGNEDALAMSPTVFDIPCSRVLLPRGSISPPQRGLVA